MKKRPSKWVLVISAIAVCLGIAAEIYVGTSIYIGYRLYDTVESSFQSKGRDYEEYTDFIARIRYQNLDYSQGFHDDWKINYHTFPVVMHNFKTAKAKYIYTIDGNFYGSHRIPVTVTLERRDGSWYVTEVHEPY